MTADRGFIQREPADARVMELVHPRRLQRAAGRVSGAVSSRLAMLFTGLLVVGSAGACAGGSKRGTINHPFPDAGKLDEIANRPAPDMGNALKSASLHLREWSMRGPFPPRPDRSGDSSSEGGLSGESEFASRLHATIGSAKLTPGMTCLARELAMFAGLNGGDASPPSSMLRYFGARCQALPVQFHRFQWDIGAAGDVDVASRMDEIVQRVSSSMPKLPADTMLGAWLGEVEGRVFVGVTFGQPQAEIEDLVSDWDDAHLVRIRGRLLAGAEWYSATITHGQLGFGSCKPTPSTAVVLPEFDIQCPVDPEDEVAMVSLVAGAPGQLLGKARALLTIPRADDSGKTVRLFEAAREGEPANTETLVAAINRVRASIGARELVVAPAQSQTAERLLPHYVVANLEDDHDTLNTIALGMMAGWDIQQPIRDASILSYTARSTESSPDLLAELLFSPSYRAMLLDPDLREIALSVQSDDAINVATTLAATYKFFEDADYSEAEVALLDELDRQRAAKGLPPVDRVGGDSVDAVVDPFMAKLAVGNISPMEGLDGILTHYSQKLQRNFAGFVLSTMVLDGYTPTFSGEIVTAKKVAATVRIGHYTTPDSSWGQFVAYLIFMPGG